MFIYSHFIFILITKPKGNICVIHEQKSSYHRCYVPVDPDVWIVVWQILRYFNAIHSHTEALD